nr:MAG TPA: hypothetical protein [Bacteriophage sp.]
MSHKIIMNTYYNFPLYLIKILLYSNISIQLSLF